MIENEGLIQDTINKIKQYRFIYQVEDYLREKGLSQEEIVSVLEIANSRISEENFKLFKKVNKRNFIIWTTATILVFVLFVFFIPYAKVSNYETLLSIVGSALLIVSFFHAFVYYKTWEDEFVSKFKKPNINYSFLPIFLIPGVLIFFIFSWRFSSVADSKLKMTQEKAIGKVISGSTVEVKRMLRSGGATFSDIVVEFETKEGKKIVAKENISTYHFKDFYIGQEVELIYSTEDPYNIDLLIDKEKISEFKGSQERDINPEDLIKLSKINREDILNELNKIYYGWRYDEQNQLWYNTKNNNALLISENEIRFISGVESNHEFPKYLKSAGFQQINEKDSKDVFNYGEKIFQKDDCIVIVSVVSANNKQNTMTIVANKTR
ncbi:hypothetical protein [Flavobacterium suncheonense]|uniref:hypothetical protein n=1 Tax=Flavobacterium suncheonense TaxID=350894 RepID=UPI003FA390C0